MKEMVIGRLRTVLRSPRLSDFCKFLIKLLAERDWSAQDLELSSVFETRGCESRREHH